MLTRVQPIAPVEIVVKEGAQEHRIKLARFAGDDGKIYVETTAFQQDQGPRVAVLAPRGVDQEKLGQTFHKTARRVR